MPPKRSAAAKASPKRSPKKAAVATSPRSGRAADRAAAKAKAKAKAAAASSTPPSRRRKAPEPVSAAKSRRTSAASSSASGAAAAPLPPPPKFDVPPVLKRMIIDTVVMAERYWSRRGYVVWLLQKPDLGITAMEGENSRDSRGKRRIKLPHHMDLRILSGPELLKQEHLLVTLRATTQAAIFYMRLMKTFRPSVLKKPQVVDLWALQLRPLLARSYVALEKGEYRAVYGQLLGLVLFASRESNWIMHEEVYGEWPDFCRYWQGLSSVWRAVIARPDEELGWNPSDGVAGGYRSRFLKFFRDFENKVNGALACLDKHCQAVGKARDLSGPVCARLNLADTPLDEK